MGRVGTPVEVNRPFVARKISGSTFEATCFTSHEPKGVAESQLMKREYKDRSRSRVARMPVSLAASSATIAVSWRAFGGPWAGPGAPAQPLTVADSCASMNETARALLAAIPTTATLSSTLLSHAPRVVSMRVDIARPTSDAPCQCVE